jgi:hypothetical protein
MGAAFEVGGRTSPEQFRRDPDSMRLVTLPIFDEVEKKGLVISIQVRSDYAIHYLNQPIDDIICNSQILIGTHLYTLVHCTVAQPARVFASYPSAVVVHHVVFVQLTANKPACRVILQVAASNFGLA